ncbi:MAG: TrmB family transcriptional regulator [Candidatus Heimdallarchaeota archaeon]|nr:MAG: TrmB family transcriptional regulator [Candidatus Heimdallarchaeota archaeon]
MTSVQNENVLERYGLTNYEFAAYKTLLHRGACDAKELSENSKVPTGRIYDVTGSLENKGLIDIQKYSRPKLYSPVDPSIAMKNLLERKREELEALTENALVVEDELKKYHRTTPSESLFWKIGIGKETIDRFNARLIETQNEMLYYGEFFETRPHNHAQEIREEAEIFADLQERGVTIKILLGTKDKEGTLQEMLELIFPVLHRYDFDKMQVKFTKTITLPFVIIDEEKVVMKIVNPANLQEYFASIYVWQRKFATELSQKFQEMWSKAEEFSMENL